MNSQEAEQLLGLLDYEEDFEPLFEPSKTTASKDGLAFTYLEQLNTLAPRRVIPKVSEETLSKIKVRPSQHYVEDADGNRFLLPTDIAEEMQRYGIKRRRGRSYTGRLDLRDPENLMLYTDDAWVKNVLPDDCLPESEYLEYIDNGKPGYYTYMEMTDGSTRRYSVYGYMADHNRLAAAPPLVPTDDLGRFCMLEWDNTEWLHRCAQCGRELPPIHYIIQKERPVSICKSCMSINRMADKINTMPRHLWLPKDEEFMTEITEFYKWSWRARLSPRGSYAEHVIGQKEIRDRIVSTRFRKMSKKTAQKRHQQHLNRLDKQLDYIRGIRNNESPFIQEK